MGRLKNVINSDKGRYGGVSFSREMVSMSSIVIHQYGSEMRLTKNRHGDPGFISLLDAIKIIIKEYSNGCDGGFTVSKMFDVGIGKEIEEAIRNILIKHKLSN